MRSLRCLGAFVVVFLLGVVIGTPAPAAIEYLSADLTGSRWTQDALGVHETAAWAAKYKPDSGFKISWAITQITAPTGYDSSYVWWNYSYTATGVNGGDLGKDISHFEVQVTEPDVDYDNTMDFRLPAKASLDTWPGGGSSDEGFPSGSSFYGVKFDFGSDLPTYSFDSDHAPVWGNFFAKDGNNNIIAAYNTGLQVSPLGLGGEFPTDSATLDKIQWIAVPDGQISRRQDVPEPAHDHHLVAAWDGNLVGAEDRAAAAGRTGRTAALVARKPPGHPGDHPSRLAALSRQG
jgi:hypothetical protein